MFVIFQKHLKDIMIHRISIFDNVCVNHLKNNVKSVVFRGEKLFKGQHTLHHYRNNHKQWLKDWEQSRYSKMMISGRKDAKYGNFVFTYVPATKNLHYTTLNGVTIEIPNLQFPYGQENVEKVIQTQVEMSSNLKKNHGNAVAWSIEDHND
ncbi:hypothetical protein [Metabacillus litoralis]|uniref:hypothetical protein n=1 Tax=Metabacillus litoralis TaxID=152268 RepID=UPI00203F6984|nr:hypothetical protein [Metabacillus litoralis]MCM3650396.1 hypothetical protein [Metabacillus litoralis]